MNDAPFLLDSMWEYAGFDGAAALQGALSSLTLPLIFALAGIAWRIFRCAEEGLLRPLAFHVLGLVALVWLLGVPSKDPLDLPHRRAPRALGLIDAGLDQVVAQTIRRINKDFLARPFEFERMALLGGLARFRDPGLRRELREFFEGCAEVALSRTEQAPAAARRNPLADGTGLDYAALVDDQDRPCEERRRELLARARREIGEDPEHRSRLMQLARYEGGQSTDLREAYLDKLVRNEWKRPEPTADELAATRASIGPMAMFDPDRQTAQGPEAFGQNRWSLSLRLGGLMDFIRGGIATGIGVLKQWVSDAISAKERQYLIVSHAPHLYGLFIMMLMALFPIAGLYSLLPGKWTVLLQYAKVLASVKLWPVGWALLTAFTERRPGVLALADAAGDAGVELEQTLRSLNPPNVFVSVSLMYFVVPAISFLVVQMVSHAAAVPFSAAAPKPAGGAMPSLPVK